MNPRVLQSSQNLIEEFLKQVRLNGKKPALWSKDAVTGDFQAISWTAWALWVKQTAMALHAFGIHPGDKVAIISENRPEWTFVDLGVLSIGAVTVPIYPTSSLPEALYVLKHSESRIVFVSSPEHAQKILESSSSCPHLKKIIIFGLPPLQPAGVDLYGDFIQMGQKVLFDGDQLYERLVQNIDPQSLATLIYTSGTTGPPKGVMLSHKNFMENYQLARAYIQVGGTDVALSFLPLSHVFERLAGYYFMMASGASIAYAENMNSVPQDIRAVRPTIAAAVPRFYEKVHAKIMEQVKSKSPAVQKLFYWAIKTGRLYQEAKRQKSLTLLMRLQYWGAERVALKKIKEAMGGRIRFFISGGAPLNKVIAEFFYAAGILILEGYGLTETSPVIAVNAEDAFKFGTVGRPLPGIEVRIADDGEILTRSACVMSGYYQDPQATAEVIREGWFSTGDIGRLDAQGFLTILDRKKDLIVTSGGKNIAPQNIEKCLGDSPLIQQAVVIGDRRNYLVALVVPQKNEIMKRAAQAGFPRQDWTELVRRKEVHDWIAQVIDEQTQAMAPYEKIKYFAVLEDELTQERGELTPTLKVKRRVVMQKYSAVIEALYDEGTRRYGAKPFPA